MGFRLGVTKVDEICHILPRDVVHLQPIVSFFLLPILFLFQKSVKSGVYLCRSSCQNKRCRYHNLESENSSRLFVEGTKVLQTPR